MFANELIANSHEYAGELGIAAEDHGLHYMRARYYSAELGRFVSADPIGLSGGDTNLYRYVQNSATNIADPSGLAASQCTSVYTFRVVNYHDPNDKRGGKVFVPYGTDINVNTAMTGEASLSNPEYRNTLHHEFAHAYLNVRSGCRISLRTT